MPTTSLLFQPGANPSPVFGSHTLETYCFACPWASSLSSPTIHFPATLKAVGNSGPHFNNCTFPEGWRAAVLFTSPARAQEPAVPRTPWLLTLRGHLCLRPQISGCSESGPPGLLGYCEHCTKASPERGAQVPAGVLHPRGQHLEPSSSGYW